VNSEFQIRDTLQPLIPPLTSLGAFWLRRSASVQIFLAFALLFAKNGFDIELRNIQEAYLPGSLLFPEPAGYFSASFGQVAFANILNLTNTTTWIVAHTVLTVVILGFIFLLIVKNRNTDRSYMILVIVATTSAAAVLISIGKYDIFTFGGGAILVLARSNWVASIGALLMASGNPEQALLVSISLLILTRLQTFKTFRARAWIALAVSLLSWIAVQFWFLRSDLDQGRLSLIPKFLGESLSNMVTDPLLQIWAWLGVGWIIVLVALILMKKNERIVVMASVIAIPALASVVTADGARVFGAIALPSFLLISSWLVNEKIKPSKFAETAVGVFVIALLLLPTTLEKPGWFDGQIRGRLMSVTSQALN